MAMEALEAMALAAALWIGVTSPVVRVQRRFRQQYR